MFILSQNVVLPLNITNITTLQDNAKLLFLRQNVNACRCLTECAGIASLCGMNRVEKMKRPLCLSAGLVESDCKENI